MKKEKLIRFITLLTPLILSMTLVSQQGIAEEKSNYIALGSAKTKKTVLAFPSLRTSNKTNSIAQSIMEVVRSDLAFMDTFSFLDSAAFVEDSTKSGIYPGSFKFSDWTSIGAEFLIKSALYQEPNQTLVLEAHLYDAGNAKEIFSKKYKANPSEVRNLGHNFANEVMHALTGLPGIFLTKIAMSCDGTGKKEIYIMDFDGSHIKQVTRHHSISFAPAWSPDGTRIAYSLYNRHTENIRNIDLYEFDFTTNTVRPLSNKKGINSGAAYSPNGKLIALTLSYRGNPEIYLLDLQSRELKQVSKSFGFSVDPNWSPDGKHLTFVSSKSGVPMVYRIQADGSQPERLTFAGRYNATPSWSPQNNKIAFAGWIDRSFDIFTMNPDGTHIERLTKNQSNNEDPYFSPDGNFIVFSSNRTGQKNIYVMNIDGTFVRRLTYGLGNCVAPKWSPPPQPIQ